MKREQGTGNREQGAGSREQGTGNREQGTGSREQGIVRKRFEDFLGLSDSNATFGFINYLEML
ncbi:hypothetical protein BJP37_04690 [Moorena bouillonii PNG]|uniref:Uncharacterized protein n=1 Tax=Moorena bouillonii PNG TaxID=568701 RepID=A0A1U7MXK7_9CYAN|nr:hypothetical protein BJP37_04690 [Moorena bouillonii PNG]